MTESRPFSNLEYQSNTIVWKWNSLIRGSFRSSALYKVFSFLVLYLFLYPFLSPVLFNGIDERWTFASSSMMSLRNHSISCLFPSLLSFRKYLLSLSLRLTEPPSFRLLNLPLLIAKSRFIQLQELHEKINASTNYIMQITAWTKSKEEHSILNRKNKDFRYAILFLVIYIQESIVIRLNFTFLQVTLYNYCYTA